MYLVATSKQVRAKFYFPKVKNTNETYLLRSLIFHISWPLQVSHQLESMQPYD